MSELKPLNNYYLRGEYIDLGRCHCGEPLEWIRPRASHVHDQPEDYLYCPVCKIKIFAVRPWGNVDIFDWANNRPIEKQLEERIKELEGQVDKLELRISWANEATKKG